MLALSTSETIVEFEVSDQKSKVLTCFQIFSIFLYISKKLQSKQYFLSHNLFETWIPLINQIDLWPLKFPLQVEDIVECCESPSDEEKFALYRECDSVLYTPPNEHFGIVPVEALQQRRPVIVCNSGGPAETVIEGVTGSKVC